MKAIFLCDSPKQLREVYTETAPRLYEIAQLGEHIFSGEELLSGEADLGDVEYIFSTWGMPALSKEEIQTHLPSLRCVFYAAGTVQKFARPFLECGVKVFSAWAANAVPVAEYTLAQIILANKGFFVHSRTMKKGDIPTCKAMKRAYPGNYGERVGLIGVGMIGSLVAEMLKPYRLDVYAFDPFLSEERAASLGVTKCTLHELFSSCRVVSNHLANNEATRGMLDLACFSRMLPYATFLNTGRGAQVVEEDLVRVLSERPDITAVLDVTYPEPPAEGHPFYSLENCVLTPHIAGSLCSETHRMAEYMREEYERFTAGLPTRYEVSEKMLETMA